MIPYLRTLAFLTLAASALAAEPKRVIVCTATKGFRHSNSIPYAESTLKKLGEDSKAFTVVDIATQPTVSVPQKPNKPGDLKADADDKAKARYADELKRYEDAIAKWTPADDEKVKQAQATEAEQWKVSMAKLSPENLRAQHIDAVIFANTTGDLPLPDRDGFIAWIAEGHAFCGMHSAGDTFHGFPGYINMLQAEFKTHGAQVPADLVAGDKSHPANAGIGDTWNITQEEMYEFKDGSNNRDKTHAIWFLRHPPQNKNEAAYFPVSWCRMEGKGRVFYTSLGHREDLWSDDPKLGDRKNSVEISKQYQAHILGGIKWALGLAEGSATPNPEVK
jgi:type 1 glutamine amidotransferase